MRQLLNTLFITREEAYASLDGENIVITEKKEEIGRFPLHILEEIYLFSYSGASPALMGKCAEKGINLVFLSPRGKFLCRVSGESKGNVLLRRKQYKFADSDEQCVDIARNFIFGKISNCRQTINRTKRDHENRIDKPKFDDISEKLRESMKSVIDVKSLDELRGIEGAAAAMYYSVFDEMILQQKESFHYEGRSRRPPLDNLNALLSFVYVLLASSCAHALEMVGLDSYVGFMHKDRSGRRSLSLDLMEELRPCMADRFVITLINNRMVSESDFIHQEDGAVLLTDEGRKKVSREWQEKKKVIIEHPFINEKIEWGLVPYVQALLLSRFLRGDLDGYPPFLWK
nr:type I-C CRISPR-associated endonuclease Cas1c [uncultured Butyrivibrio sp.]